MNPAEQMQKEVNLGMYQVLASLGEDLKVRDASPTTYRDRFDSASNFQSLSPHFQGHSSVVTHPPMDHSAGIMWPAFPPNNPQPHPSNMQGMHEGESPIYPVYRPQP